MRLGHSWNRAGLAVLCVGVFATSCTAQTPKGRPIQVAEAATNPAPGSNGLPDSPGFVVETRAAGLTSTVDDAWQTGTPVAPQIAPKYKRIIKADQTALPLSAGDKIALSFRQRLTPVAQASTIISAGLSHLTDSRPHYGTDSAGFGERLGAAELRQASQSILSNGIFAAIFHDDPRYYILGPSVPVKKRAIYAASRIVLTRKDNGRRAINFPQLMGIASAQAIANSYYPTRDQSVRRAVTGTFSSYGTTAAFNEVNEFLGDVIAHFRHRQQP